MKTLMLIILANLFTVVCLSQDLQESFTVIRADDLHQSGSIFNLEFNSYTTCGELTLVQEDFELLRIDVLASDGSCIMSLFADYGLNRIDVSPLDQDKYDLHISSMINNYEMECYTLIRLGNKQNSVAAIEGSYGRR